MLNLFKNYHGTTNKSETEANMECFIYLVIGEVVCHETETKRQYQQGKSFAEHNKNVFDVAMAVAKFYQEQLDLRMDAYERERQALAEIEKLKQELSRCRAKNAAYLREKKHAQLAEWLQELAAFKDETPITEKWLQANGYSESGWMKINDSLIRCYETGRDRYFASVDNDDRNFHEEFGRIKTIGQFKMFLTLCGLQDFVTQLKS